MFGTAAKIVIGLIASLLLVVAVLFALLADLVAHETRPRLRRATRTARPALQSLKEART